MTTRTSRIPAIAAEIRQPTGFWMPTIHSPIAMNHLPTCGCTTYDACVE